MLDQIQDMVSHEADRAGLVLNPIELEQLARFVDLLVHWGKHMNLTARPEAAIIVQRHLIDAFVLITRLSLLYPSWRSLPGPPAEKAVLARGLDIGSGAGIPGLILATLLPGLQLSLVEPNQRKCSFLRTAIHELHLTAKVHAKRFEDVALPPHDLLCSRATWSPQKWLTLASNLLHHSGALILFVVHPSDLPPLPAGLMACERFSYELRDGSPRCLIILQQTLPPSP
jgi:16S rRNA (guanine527-N7)-methyltransferase